MQNGKRAALAVALAGLLAAGTAGVTLAQDEDQDQAPAAPSTHLFLLVPVPPSAGGAQAPGERAAPGEDQDDSAAPPDAAAGQQRSFILIPIPQAGQDEDDNATDGDDDNDAAPGNVPAPDDVDSGAQQGAGTLILVPQAAPHALPPGVLEA